MMKRSLVLAAALALYGAVAAAQDAPPVLGGDREATAELARIITNTQAQGLPVDPILERVQRGLMMHSAPQRIVAAARAIATRLPIARDALMPRAIAVDIAAGEGALSYGVPKSALTEIRNASSERSVAVPLGALTQLVASHVSVERASQIVISLIKRGVSGNQLTAFSNNVNSDVALGGLPDDALNVRMRGLTAALAPAGGSAAASAPGITTTGASKPTGKTP